MSVADLMTQIREMFIVIIAHLYFTILFIVLIVIQYLFREFFLWIVIADFLSLPGFIIVKFVIEILCLNQIVFREDRLVF